METKKLISKITAILSPAYLEPQSGKSCCLEEDKAPNYPKTKVAYKGQLYLYKFDKEVKHKSGIGIELFPFFEPGNARKMCDYIAFYVKEDKIFSIIFNLKSNNEGDSKQQIQAGKDFIAFIVAVAERCGNAKFCDLLNSVDFFVSKKTYRSDTYNRRQKPALILLSSGKDIDLDEYCL